MPIIEERRLHGEMPIAELRGAANPPYETFQMKHARIIYMRNLHILRRAAIQGGWIRRMRPWYIYGVRGMGEVPLSLGGTEL